VDREEVEREVWAAAHDPKRSTLAVRWDKPNVTVSITVRGIPNCAGWWAGFGKATCAPEDCYNAYYGYTLAIRRAVDDITNRIAFAEKFRKIHNDERRREWEEQMKSQVMPQMKQMVKVEGGLVWCDDEHVAAIKAIPGVIRLRQLITEKAYVLSVDPRYDYAEVIAAIEAVGE
jgi:hypothetical protein